MHVLHWLLTGLMVGLIARLSMTRHMSLGADLALGGLGGLATGSLMRYVGITSPDSGGFVHVLIAFTGAIGTIAAMHGFLHVTHKASRLVRASNKPVDINSALAALGEPERKVLGKFLAREPVARDTNVEVQAYSTLGQRAADKIAAFGGSWAFLGLFGTVLIAWMLFNLETKAPFDPYPFILLNLLLSCLAAVQAPIILMSQNRQAEIDRIQARQDYEVNLKAEVEIMALHDKLDEIRHREWRDSMLELQSRQLELLQRLEKSLH